MIYQAGVEDIEPDHWVAWAFAKPGLTGRGTTAETAVAHLQTLLNGEVEVVERFDSFLSQEDPEYIVNAFFEDDRRPLTETEVETALDELMISRRALLALIEPVPSVVLGQTIPGERFTSIYGILRHIAVAEWWYCDRLGGGGTWDALPREPLAALAASRATTGGFLPSLIGDTRTATLTGETWSARKVLRRALWHERDHTQHIARHLQELR